MSPVPQSASNSLLTELSQLSRASARNEMLLYGFEARARALLRTDAAWAYQVLGAVASIRGDIPTMRADHERTLKLIPDSALAHGNYAVSLARTGFFAEACTYSKQAFARDAAFRSLYVKQLVYAGYFSRAGEVALEATPTSSFEELIVPYVLRLMQRHGIMERDTSRLVQIAADVLHDDEIFTIDSAVCALEDEDAQSAALQLSVPASPQRLMDLIDKFASAAVDSDISPATSSVFCIRFSQLEESTDGYHPEAVARTSETPRP